MADDSPTPIEWPIENGAIVLHGGNSNYPTVETIVISGITATRITRTVKWETDALICIGIGVVTMAIALIFNTDTGPSAFVVGILLVAIGLFLRWRTKAVYRLVVVSGGAETVAAEGTDEARIEAAGVSLDRLLTTSE